MLLFVGLGNIGTKYAANRHNIGFMAVDRIASRFNFHPWRSRFQGQSTEGLIEGTRVVLLKPSTYMNESGRSVQDAAHFYKIPLGDIIVFHDELDLAPAKIRVKTGGGNAGHNGLRSITAHSGNDFVRVRLGIGHPGDKERVHSYVLGDFAKSEGQWLDVFLRAVADEAPHLAQKCVDKFQTNVHLALDAAGCASPPVIGAV
jgi:peptidyl-tRNA hydrolase, PTH1 family